MKVTSTLVGIGLASAALATGGAALLTGFFASLQKADTLKAQLTAQVFGQAPSAYRLEFQKPNKARIDGPKRLTLADGTTLFVLDKASRKWAKRPQTNDAATSLLTAPELALWTSFFGKATAPGATRDEGAVQRDGQTLDRVRAGNVLYYLNRESGLLRQAVISGSSSADPIIVDAPELKLDQPVSEGAFDWKAPDGSKEVNWDEIDGLKWFTDLEEAKRKARAEGKLIFVDFMATWCGPCKLLDAQVLKTPKFAKYANKMVFVRIDVDQQKSVAAAYRIEAMPTQMVLFSDGSIKKSTVGYADPATFYMFVDEALAGVR